MGTFNKRGITSRGATEGGQQEFELAARYRDWAARVVADSPKTARVLRSLADGYDEEGRRQDEQAQRLREGFGI